MSTRAKMLIQSKECFPPGGACTASAAGGLFTQHELATNVLIKDAVWRLSNERFDLILPQSREKQGLDRPDVVTYIRNTDLLEVVRADFIVAKPLFLCRNAGRTPAQSHPDAPASTQLSKSAG